MQNRKKRSLENAASDQTRAKKARILASDTFELKQILLHRSSLNEEFNTLTSALNALIPVIVKVQKALTQTPGDTLTVANLAKLTNEANQLTNQRGAVMIARRQIDKRITTLLRRIQKGNSLLKIRMAHIGAQKIRLSDNVLSNKFILAQKLYEQEEQNASIGHLSGALVTEFFATKRKLDGEIGSLQKQIKAHENLLLNLEEELDELQKIVSEGELLTKTEEQPVSLSNLPLPSINVPSDYISNTSQFLEEIPPSPVNKAQRFPFKVSFSDYTFAELHQLICQSSTLNCAANSIYKNPQVITSYLGKFLYEGEPLTFQRLKDIPVDSLIALLGKYYDTHLVPKRISLKKDTIAYIHEQVIHSNSLQNAVDRLGVQNKALDTFFNIHQVTYQEFKNMTVEAARLRWGDDYDKNYYGAYVIKNQRTILEDLKEKKEVNIESEDVEVKIGSIEEMNTAEESQPNQMLLAANDISFTELEIENFLSLESYFDSGFTLFENNSNQIENLTMEQSLSKSSPKR